MDLQASIEERYARLEGSYAKVQAELEQKSQELREALDREAATSEVLRVISRSAFDLEAVLSTVVENASRLCNAEKGFLFRFDGEFYRLAVDYGASPEFREFMDRHPIRPVPGTLTGLTAIERQPVHIHDALTDPRYTWAESQQLGRYRTMLGVPLLREGNAIGVIALWREEVRPFTERQIDLVRTFADQAVLAVENARLFNELQARTAELTRTVEQLTALGEVSRSLSSTLDLDRVLSTVVSHAVQLSASDAGAIYEFDEATAEFELRATYQMNEELIRALQEARVRLGESLVGKAAAQRVPMQVADILTESAYPLREILERAGFRAVLATPLLHEDQIVGALVVRRRRPGDFAEEIVELLQTFSSQSALAIQNARMFYSLDIKSRELERVSQRAEQLYRLSTAMQEPLSLDEQLGRVLEAARGVIDVDRFLIWGATEDGAAMRVLAGAGFTSEEWAIILGLQIPMESVPAVARVYRDGVPLIFGPGHPVPPALSLHPPYSDIAPLRSKHVVMVPMITRGRAVGVLTVDNSRRRAAIPPRVAAELLPAFASQAAVAVDNARLYREIGEKSRQLEAASRHKSEFLANMSHELRTPLNAIIGFSEVLTERMFGEINEKQDEYLRDIYASGQHLLSLINDILDLSKIEAGRMELESTDFDLRSAIENALILVRERASRRGIALGHAIDERLGMIRADERKVKQVLLNLLSNALKFTREGGQIDVSANAHDDLAEIAVSDTGVGIAPEDQEAVFEEFRQVGGADKKAEGTGLGLALCRKFVELHGGRIWVESQVGQGSTFTFTLPMRRED